jgi:hypothetical protein
MNRVETRPAISSARLAARTSRRSGYGDLVETSKLLYTRASTFRSVIAQAESIRESSSRQLHLIAPGRIRVGEETVVVEMTRD